MFAAETFDPRLMWDDAAQRTFFEARPPGTATDVTAHI